VENLAIHFDDLLRAPRPPPCLSLYQPTHRHFPSNQQDRIRFKNLLAKLRDALRDSYPQREHARLLGPLNALAEDQAFWNRTLDGLAVMRSEETFRVYRLQRSVPELAFTADSFHFKPLIRILQSADRYQLLALTLRSVRLFEGNRDVIDEVPLDPDVPRTIEDALGPELTDSSLTGSTRTASGNMMFHGHGSRRDERNIDADRFFREVDRSIWIHHSRPSGLPLFLVALPEHHKRFRRISRNPLLDSDGISADPQSLDMQTLRELGWQAEEPRYLALTAELVDRFRAARSHDCASDDQTEVALAAASARVATLIVDADRHIHARLDCVSGNIYPTQTPGGDDLLDDVSELVLKRGGRVVVLPGDRMPTQSGLAAIYRY
jgi:hypothetical protein